MPMFSWSNRLLRCEKGAAAVEFALALPVLLLLLLVTTELGRALYQANAVEKGVRAGALFAARNPLPLTEDVRQAIENLVRTGDMEGNASVLASGWNYPDSSLSIDHGASFGTDPNHMVPIIRITASVPFAPLMPGLAAFFGLGQRAIVSIHEQAYVGD